MPEEQIPSECPPPVEPDSGLRGVVVASTRISDVVGDKGKLIYRGYLVWDLAEKTTFEEVTHLLLYEKLPDKKELEDFRKHLAKERSIAPEVIDALKSCPKDALPMDILQAGVMLVSPYDPDLTEMSKEAGFRKSVRLIAKLPTIVAAWDRIRNGNNPIEPDPSLGHAANFLYMLTGKKPGADVEEFFDTALLLHAEHSFNASTFAAREIASTRAHIYAAVSGAVGALSGDLHGGANTRVMKMLQEIDSVDNIEEYINRKMDEGEKIMGLGHAVYNTDDPRAMILAPMSKKMGEIIGETKWYDISTQLEKKAKEIFKKRKNFDIYVNVDFYSGSLYYAMGIPVDLFTPVFAIARVSGWTAHVMEQQFPKEPKKAALYRPSARYVGEYCGPEECSWEPIESR